jgi:hypothetical protein
MFELLLFPVCCSITGQGVIVDKFDSLPLEEAERILHTRNVAIGVRMYRKLNQLPHLALLMYGGEEVFASFAQSLGDTFLAAYVSQPASNRQNPEEAITHMLHTKHTDRHRAAILLSMLEPERIAEAAELLGVSTEKVETALVAGIATLLNAQQLVWVQTLSFTLQFGTMVVQKMDEQD